MSMKRGETPWTHEVDARGRGYTQNQLDIMHYQAHFSFHVDKRSQRQQLLANAPARHQRA